MRQCAFEGCDLPVNARGLCGTHYSQLRARGDVALLTPRRPYCSLTDDECEAWCEDYQHLIDGGAPAAEACVRLGRSARQIIRYYKRLGRPVPSALQTASRYTVAELREQVAS